MHHVCIRVLHTTQTAYTKLFTLSYRYRNAGQTLQMMGFQNVANFSTEHQWLQARATMDMNPHLMIRAQSGVSAAQV